MRLSDAPNGPLRFEQRRVQVFLSARRLVAASSVNSRVPAARHFRWTFEKGVQTATLALTFTGREAD
jgi:hypothetical protein